MSVPAPMSVTASEGAAPRTIPPGVLGMLLFIASETMFFAGLFAAYAALRADQPRWPPAGTPATSLVLPAVLTVVLMASSVTQHLAAHTSDGGVRRRWLSRTIALGALFLAGQAWEWSQLRADGLTVATNVYGTVFFLLTGAHGLHVVGGLVMLGGTRARLAGAGSPGAGIPGAGPPGDGARMAAVTYYWHFVDAVWLVVFATLYVL